MKTKTTAEKRNMIKNKSTLQKFRAMRTGEDTFDFEFETKYGVSRLGPVKIPIGQGVERLL